MVKILIINDTNVVNKFLKRNIESDEFSVDAVLTGGEGIEAAKDGTYHLIMLDYKLPDINGDEVCKTLKADEKTKNVPIYYMSAMEKEKIDQLIADTGAQGYIDVTLDPDQLAEKIKALV